MGRTRFRERLGTRDGLRPLRAVRPVFREPTQGAFQTPRGDVALSAPELLEDFSIAEHEEGGSGNRETSRLTIGRCDGEQLIDRVHAASMRFLHRMSMVFEPLTIGAQRF